MNAKRAGIVLMVVAGLAAAASARPVDGANVNMRVFNDDPDSDASFVNNYPTSIAITDKNVNGDGIPGEFANRHNFRLSSGGVDAAFANNVSFSFAADVTINGPGFAEGGLNISPWWSQQVDGNFMLNTGNHEVAVFGGRLPFYSFTANHGVKYFAGQTVRCGVIYNANSLTAEDPGTIEYTYFDGTNSYSSGVIAFDQGNPAEDPPHGLWGLLNDYMVGGYYMAFVDTFSPDPSSGIVFGNIEYVPAPASAALLGLAGLVAGRRRR
ncbi:MAG: hypothetical protein GIKADHBN_02114 [Phycisphaerales bacterium]|nr:hypothetical protein [Phycisphaerales bacterium]